MVFDCWSGGCDCNLSWICGGDDRSVDSHLGCDTAMEKVVMVDGMVDSVALVLVNL